ncbi:MAG: elongation factor P [Candidatus Margulisiibacteriota bacterium]
MVVQSQDLRPGMTVEIDSNLFIVLEYNHIKMGRGGAVIRAKFKNIRTGATIEKTFKSGEKVNLAHIERKQMQFLYSDPDSAHFMDQTDFNQVAIDRKLIGENLPYMKDGDIIQITFYEDEAIGVDLPAAVPLKIIETPPEVRGNTVSGGTKDATLETGLIVKVPLFMSMGDVVKVDTRTGKYIERV